MGSFDNRAGAANRCSFLLETQPSGSLTDQLQSCRRYVRPIAPVPRVWWHALQGSTAIPKTGVHAFKPGVIAMTTSTSQPLSTTPLAREQDSSPIRPFRVAFPEQEIAELRRRLVATRWPTKELVADRSQGVQLATLRALCHYWASEYDGRRLEVRLNALPQFTTKIDGLDIHFIHARSRHESALPLILTHGWPGSVIEFLDAVGPLINPTEYGGTPRDAFHVVLPSLPGYGFSAQPAESGWDSQRIARAWATLMKRLGYNRYVAQGGDVGADVTDAMGRQGPAGLLGVHLNLLTPALGRRRSAAEDIRAGARGARRARGVQDEWLRLLSRAVHPTSDDRLFSAGLARRARGLADRSRHRQLLQNFSCIRGRRARGPSHPRQPPRQPHAVLADGNRGIRCPLVLGVRAVSGRRGWLASSAGIGSRRFHDVPG
ncbi:MAG TPA: epoxide hydrolase [Polyangiaceae bacterium]|nr:epoxide hydrolase [Polyangiaceae bacterium]